ncbi:c-type cytochrome biogenesis protein CcmI [Halomonas sp. McH1-25]|uniref:c-type cytochrome biogenesis protein CcmI n=1 Tax=unclassified Halomonas TaxID=2609666 RepID=UPI001EF532BD|nr:MULTISPECIES: c-type cytochrome biogenesis protein CcmI [unclassified Halomonas]MCG7601462.1 c-type cytochrome biogenesis protein CcmI [Halomonas sp. McH1-25]MCP1344482.1 c-type cytochrome biogenesis protein CcmI [Halomonas sp. FL8]MCP1362952.1 c-type cytochrome biogenesis protein CcmI [Halomonas sp. BBD45]MCP1366226.1 c-type cytochrome biogenesis protein CcmI [Halomonas sp. BBD48]
MNLLWIALGLLLLPALWLVVLPLRRAAEVHAAQQAYETEQRDEAQNVAAYRRRLASLEAARERGEIDAARFEESRLELDRSLLEDTQARRHAPLKSPRAGRALVPVLMVALAVASLVWYQREGAEGDLALFAARQAVVDSPDASLTMLIERFEEQAERQPDNPKVWLALFPLYRDSGQFDKAIVALERLIALEGRQVNLLAQLAQMEFFVANRTLTDDVQALADEVLARDPRQPTVLSMLGLEAFDHGRYEDAIDYWRRAIAGMSNPDAAEALRSGIATARQRLGVAPESSETPSDGPSLTVNVSLAEHLRSQVSESDTVFVVVRDVEGKLPPLAVERATVADLPFEVTLDDSDAMAPMARISQVDEVSLTVRVSASGEAMPQPGDLVGQAGPVTLADAKDPVAVTIDGIVD